jgi:hypothetical protein
MRLLTTWLKYLTENLLPSRSGVELPAEFDIDPKPPYLETVAFQLVADDHSLGSFAFRRCHKNVSP